MRSILLAVYGVRVKAAHTRRDFELLDSFSTEGVDLLDCLKEILELYKAQEYLKQDTQEALQVGRVNTRQRQIEGLVEIGRYGSESVIRNLDRWREVAYRKLVRDVDLEPFYFLFDIPEGKNLGLLLMQRTGVEGAQAILAEGLHEPFVKQYPDYRIQMTPIVPEKLIQEFQNEQAEATEIRFIRHRVPRDISTLLGPDGTEHTTGTMELVLRPREPVLMQAFRRYIDERRGRENILELEETRFQYDNVKIKVKVHGKERTMDLADPKRIRPTFDVTDQVRLSAAGHPSFKSISDVAKALLDDLKDELYGSGRNAP